MGTRRPRIRTGFALRTKAIVAGAVDADADPRFVDEAVRVMSVDAKNATRTLGNMRTERAVDELVQWADDAAGSETFDDLARCAIFELQRMGEPRAAPVILRWLERRDTNDAAQALIEALQATAAAEHVPLLDELAKTSPHAPAYRALANRLRAKS